MADQEFLASFGVQIDESGLNRLQKAKLPGKKAMIITGGTSTTKLGYVDRVVSLLKDRGIESVV